jgi:bacterioferritin-associated ferredoxin
MLLTTGQETTVYICLCNGLTDDQIARAIAEGAARPREVYAACGCRAQCSGCTRTVVAILRDGAGCDQRTVARG